MPRQATVQFIAMLRALDRVVASHSVSHAELERRLCDWIVQGRNAEIAIRENPGEQDRKRLQALVDRKAIVEQSGLARMDGRRDRAGGQRIGELVNGKFAPGTMPPRRRVEVCVDVFLSVLEDNDPDGYLRGMYGTRESWRDWWLQADQGHLPDIGDRSLTVWGYLGVALEQLTETRYPGVGLDSDGESRADPAVSDSPAPGQAERLVAEARAERDAAVEEARRAAALLDEVRTEADRQVAGARAERDAAVEEARRAAALLDEVRTEVDGQVAEARSYAERKVAEARAERDAAVRKARLTGGRLLLVIGAAAALIAAVGVFGWVAAAGRPTALTVELASPAQQVTAAQQPVFPFTPGLPAGRDWTLHITMTVTATNVLSACTYGMQITAHIVADGRPLPSFTSSPSQTTISYTTHLGERGNRSLRLVITQMSTDPTCTFVINPAGSEATG